VQAVYINNSLPLTYMDKFQVGFDDISMSQVDEVTEQEKMM